MRKYEVMYILKADLEDAVRQELMNNLHGIITNGGGTVEVADERVREFAYEIDYMKKGYYVVINAACDTKTLSEFDRLMRINQNVIRHMIINLEEK